VDPAPVATAPAAPPPPGLDLDQVVESWPAVMDRVREESELMAHALSVARPAGLDDDGPTLQLGFPGSAAFNRRKAESADGRELIARAIREVTGAGVRIRCVTSAAGEPAAPAPARISEEDLIDQIKAEFGAEEIQLSEAGEAGGDQDQSADKTENKSKTTGEAAA
jgi:hypothetical protein